MSTLHRIFGYIAGVVLRQILGTSNTVGNGKFNIHFKYIAFRLGLDKNQIIIADVVWYNTEAYKSTPYFLKIEEISLTFDIISLYKNIMSRPDDASKNIPVEITPIIMNEIMISGVHIHIEKSANKENSGGLNLWSALGAGDNKQEEKSLQSELCFVLCVSCVHFVWCICFCEGELKSNS